MKNNNKKFSICQHVALFLSLGLRGQLKPGLAVFMLEAKAVLPPQHGAGCIPRVTHCELLVLCSAGQTWPLITQTRSVFPSSSPSTEFPLSSLPATSEHRPPHHTVTVLPLSPLGTLCQLRGCSGTQVETLSLSL